MLQLIPKCLEFSKKINSPKLNNVIDAKVSDMCNVDTSELKSYKTEKVMLVIENGELFAYMQIKPKMILNDKSDETETSPFMLMVKLT